MTRDEHLQWCKRRALEYLDRGDVVTVWTSMLSDLGKHDETRNHVAIELGMQLYLAGHLRTVLEMRRFIEGFN